MNEPCTCGTTHCPAGRRVVLTGGPGAGKTAALEVIRRLYAPHVAVLPESASIVFGGGFPRRATAVGVRCAQIAIYRVQEQLERLAVEEPTGALTLCDRGMLDGLAYWPGGPEGMLAEVGRDRTSLLARYDLVIHLRTPSDGDGYGHSNPLRVEDAAEAHRIDERILANWEGHPRRVVVDSTHDFRVKLDRVLALVRDELPAACRARVPGGA